VNDGEALLLHERSEKRFTSAGHCGRSDPEACEGTRAAHFQALAVLENAFMFMADLVRALDVPVVCQFIKPKYSKQPSKQQGSQSGEVVEIFFSHEPDIRGQHILLVEGLVHSGVTSEFLMNDLRARGAASVKLVTLLDRQSARRVALQPDYFGFLVDETFLVGYGLGAVEQTNRNIPYLAASPIPQMT
jgi:hypoxanthine phosphoribosyltransferase